MRFSIVPILLFLISAVLSSPLYFGYGPYASSLVERGETGNNKAGFLGPLHKGGHHSLGGHDKLKSRPTTVADAIKMKGRELGRGSMGVVFELPFGYGAFERPAVLKVMVMAAKRSEGKAAIAAFVTKEVQNLMQVQQYLAWGYQQSGEEEIYFIVMKFMGETGDKYGLTMQEQLHYLDITREEYLEQYHMIHNDAKPDNMVFQHKSGEPQAQAAHTLELKCDLESHLIDWGAGKIAPGHELPHAGRPERIRSSPFGSIKPSCMIV